MLMWLTHKGILLIIFYTTALWHDYNEPALAKIIVTNFIAIAHNCMILINSFNPQSISTCKPIIQYSSTVYRDHDGLGILVPKYHPKTSLILILLYDI